MAVHRKKRRWSDLEPWQQKAIIVGGAIETAGTAISLRDLSRRSSDQIRGPKLAWVAASFVQPVGPIAYWLFGRR